MKRFLWLGVVAFLSAILPGCGDVFRPIIIPNPPVFPSPAAAHTIVTMSDNGDVTAGSAMVIDVSGDSEVSIKSTDIHPVHVVQQTATQVLALNQAVAGLAPPPSGCLVTSNGTIYDVCPSLTKLTFSGTIINGVSSLSLPPSSAASFVAVAPNDTKAYVTLPAYVPDPNYPNDDGVAVIDTTAFAVKSIFRVGNDPEALAVTPDKTKLYVANMGDGTMSAFNTQDLSARTITGSLTSPPIWLAARTDSQQVYVLEKSGTLAWLNTTTTTGPDVLTETAITVPNAATMIYDSVLNRLYIPGGGQVGIVDVSQSAPQPMATISIPQVPGDPPVNATAVAVAALPDGSRAYITSVPTSAQPSQVSISGVQGDGTTATYSYMLTGGHDLTSGLVVTVSGIGTPTGFDGTFIISVVSGTSCATQTCTFQVPNTTVASQTAVNGVAASTIDNLFPQVTVVTTKSNTIETTVGVPGFPDATAVGSPYYVPICATTRFRFTMAAAGDSTRAYLASCDGGSISLIDTSTDTYHLSAPAPSSTRPPIPPSLQNPPQNPVFMIAGP